ncbi:unnamed protein product [Paramecium sonneborni]|uniref:Uncharacterized protein n=1 Tax=Paramecium sonneborni TaxID=65129 RepID=A0A8S1RP28_9CILI|nr:unnamed protein product [Paramecium sonneborni]
MCIQCVRQLSWNSQLFLIELQTFINCKGWLELRIRSQNQLDYSIIVNSLIGDRYDKLRLNIFDIQLNHSIQYRKYLKSCQMKYFCTVKKLYFLIFNLKIQFQQCNFRG